MKKYHFIVLVMTLLFVGNFQATSASASNQAFTSFNKDIVEIDDAWKTWTITASNLFDEDTVTNESVYILDEFNNRVPLKELKVEFKKVTVSPATAYQYNHTYTLYLNDQIQSKHGKALSPVKFQFVVKEPVDTSQNSIALTENLVAQVSNTDFNQFSLNLIANGQVVGGYETANGVSKLGYTIGQSTNSRGVVYQKADHVDYYFLFDLTTGKLRAIYWELASAYPIIQEWNQSTSYERNVAISELYAMLASEFRVKANISPVMFNEALTSAAFEHSKDMGNHNYFSHTSMDGRSMADRVWAVCSSCSAIAENIAANQQNIFLAHHGWINSPGHRRNLLNERYTHIGFGFYYTNIADYDRYYTTNFGQIN